MHRVYCDSNVYRILKTSHPSFNLDLLKTFSDLNDILLFIYSDAHLDDLKQSSDKAKTDEDLLLIGDYCKDNYFSYGHIGKENQLEIYLATPIDAFYSRDYEAAEKAIAGGFSIDSLFQDFDDDPQMQSIQSLLKSYFDLPISLFGSEIDMSVFDEKTKSLFDKMLPGYNSNMSLGDFMNSFMPYGAKLLTDQKEFTELRKFSSEYIDSNEFSYKNWGLGFNEKLKESAFGKTFLELIDSSLIEAHKKDPLYKFTYTYGLLETYGIVQERTSKNKLKKFTYDSLNRDASHAFYASYCDYLVTDDKGLQIKAHILYHLFGIKTEILSTQDFINRRSLWLANEETYTSLAKSFEHDSNHSFQVLDHTSIGTGRNLKEFKTTHPYFNYFNRFQIITDEDGVYAFFCRRDSDTNFFLYREIELLTAKLLKTFGIDDSSKGPFSMAEKAHLKDDVPIRAWHIGQLELELLCSHISSGNYLVLTLRIVR
jgi:hypothetical protein